MTWRLPYMYATIKSKCFANGAPARRSCTQPGHSCVRKIISHSMWPNKRMWQMISRALETATKHHGGGFEAWTLKEAPSLLRRRIAAMTQIRQQAPSHDCNRCHAPLQSWTIVVADAGQFFEATEAARVDDAARNILQRTESATGCSTITVMRSKKRRAYFGGALVDRGSSTKTFAHAQLQSTLAGVCRGNACSVGNHVAKMTGLPVGGYTSKVCCSMVLADAEFRWSSDTQALVQQGFISPGSKWASTVASARYVDDVIHITGVLCRSCVPIALDRMYPVKFDPVEPAVNTQWLDMSVNSDDLAIAFAPKSFSTVPACFSTATSLRAYIICRMSRMREIDVETPQAIEHVLRMCTDLVQCGWTPRHFRHVFYSVQGLPADRYNVVLRLVLRVAAGVRHSEETFITLRTALAQAEFDRMLLRSPAFIAIRDEIRALSQSMGIAEKSVGHSDLYPLPTTVSF